MTAPLTCDNFALRESVSTCGGDISVKPVKNVSLPSRRLACCYAFRAVSKILGHTLFDLAIRLLMHCPGPPLFLIFFLDVD